MKSIVWVKTTLKKRKYSSPATMCSIVKKSKIGKLVEALSLEGRKRITIDGSNYVNQMKMLNFPLEGQRGISVLMYQFGKEESKTYDELYDEIIIQNFKTIKRINFNKIKDVKFLKITIKDCPELEQIQPKDVFCPECEHILKVYDASNLREVSWGTGIARISFRGTTSKTAWIRPYKESWEGW